MSFEAVDGAPGVVTVEPFDEHGAVVVVEGDLDVAVAPQFREAVGHAIDTGHHHLVIDLTGATFIDSAALGTLLRAIAPLRTNPAAAVVLAGAHGVVERSLEVSGVGAMFTLFDTCDAGVAAVTNPQVLRTLWRGIGQHASPAS
jgi:anti-sigma B factor antagonist